MADFEKKMQEFFDQLDDDEDFSREVRNNIDWDDFIPEALEDPDVKDAMKRLFIRTLDNFDLDDRDDEVVRSVKGGMDNCDSWDTIVEKIDWDDEEMKSACVHHVKYVLENLDNDDYADEIKNEIIKEDGLLDDIVENDDEVKEDVKREISQYLSNSFDLDDVDDFQNKIMSVFNIDILLFEMASNGEIQEKIKESVKEAVLSWASNFVYNNTKVNELLNNNDGIKNIINNAIDNLSSSKEFEKVIVGFVKQLIEGNDNISGNLLGKISDAIAGKLAEGIVKTAFGNKSGY
jgi:hypothetical protein